MRRVTALSGKIVIVSPPPDDLLLFLPCTIMRPAYGSGASRLLCEEGGRAFHG